MVLDNKFQQR